MNIIFYLLEVVFITLTYKAKSKNRRYVWIFLCGLCYVSLGFVNLNKNYDYMKFIIIGLLFSYLGDLTLDKWNEFGIIVFALAHVFYCIGYYQQVVFDGFVVVICCGVSLTVFSMVAIYPFFKSKTKKGLHNLIFYYIIFLCVMVTVAFATKQKVRLVGAVLFYLSDICTAYVIWVSSRDKNWKYFRMLQLPLYYSAQLFLAESY